MSCYRKFLLLISLTVTAVWAAVPDGESIRRASFVFRKKAYSADSIECSTNFTCSLQKEFCAAFHLGEGFYVTSAHCLVATANRKDAGHDRLDIVGVGLVDVTVSVHKNFTHFNGVDIAWINVDDLKLSGNVLEVANSAPEKCIRYQLELLGANSSNFHSGFRWVRQPETVHPTSTDLKPFREATLAFHFSEELDQTGLEHVIMCSAKEHPDDLKLQFIAYGRTSRVSFDTDCYRAMCGEYKSGSTQSFFKTNFSSSEEEQSFVKTTVNVTGKPKPDTPMNTDFHVMNMSVLSDAFEISGSNQPQLPKRSSSVHDPKATESLPRHSNNFDEELSLEPLPEGSNVNPIYSAHSLQIPSPLTDGASPAYSPNYIDQIRAKIPNSEQNGERCGSSTTTSTCQPFSLEPSSPATTESSISTGPVCGTHQQVLAPPSTNQTFNSSTTTGEDELERRRQKALRKIMIHLVRGRNDAPPGAMAGSVGFVLVAMGFVILMMVI